MKKCVNCGSQFETGAFCTNCGGRLAEIPSPGNVCPQCGSEKLAGSRFCTACGFDFSAQQQNTYAQSEIPGGTQPVYAGFAPQPSVDGISYNDFVNNYADAKLKKDVKSTFILMLVLAIINVVIAVAGGIFPIDGILMLVIAIWWKKVPSRPCAITALVFAIVEMVISLIVFKRLTGWLILVGAVYMMIQSKKLTDSYNTFRQSH